MLIYPYYREIVQTEQSKNNVNIYVNMCKWITYNSNLSNNPFKIIPTEFKKNI